MRPFTRLVIPELLRDSMVAQARAAMPNECCGLLAGRIVGGTAFTEVKFTIRNDANSPTAYFTDTEDLLVATKAIRSAKLVELAIYHSHPTSAAIPSRKDLEQNTWGETVAHVIIGMVADDPEVRAWWLREIDYEDCPVV